MTKTLLRTSVRAAACEGEDMRYHVKGNSRVTMTGSGGNGNPYFTFETESEGVTLTVTAEKPFEGRSLAYLKEPVRVIAGSSIITEIKDSVTVYAAEDGFLLVPDRLLEGEKLRLEAMANSSGWPHMPREKSGVHLNEKYESTIKRIADGDLRFSAETSRLYEFYYDYITGKAALTENDTRYIELYPSLSGTSKKRRHRAED